MPSHVRLRGVKIFKIEVGDYLFTEDQDHKWIEVTDISFDDTVVRCGNIFSSSGTKTYFANGILAYEEYPYIFPWMMRYWMYHFCKDRPILKHFKDIFYF